MSSKPTVVNLDDYERAIKEEVAKETERPKLKLKRQRIQRNGGQHEPTTVHRVADKLRNDVALEYFYAYLPDHSYLLVPSRALWPAASINACIAPVTLVDDAGEPILDNKGQLETIRASTWLDQNRHVTQMTWAPGLPLIVENAVMAEGGWREQAGASCFNLYHAPTMEPGDPSKADPWLDLIRRNYPDEADYIVRWLAQRVQHPEIKINHALLLGGDPGIGKDTILEPVKRAIGAWNFHEASPKQMLGRFNGFLKAVILRINEARDLGEFDRFAFYDHSKVYIASPPDVLLIDEKNLREHYIVNVVGIVITTNHKTNGIYLPANCRRHLVAWSERKAGDFAADYWKRMYGWYDAGGDRHVAAYLSQLDISKFDPKAPPPKTPAFWEIVNANHAPENPELADVLDELNRPNAVTLSEVTKQSEATHPDFAAFLHDRRNSRLMPHRFEECGYVAVSNPTDKSDGRWKINGKRYTIYGKTDLSVHDRFVAARELIEKLKKEGRRSEEQTF